MRNDAQAPAVILLVEDEPSILSSLRRVLGRDRYEVLTAESGAAGLAVLESRSVDVVVSDMRMPGISGVEFLSEVIKRWPQTMRLLLTAFADLKKKWPQSIRGISTAIWPSLETIVKS